MIKNFNITIVNSRTSAVRKKVVQKISFPEAAAEAYLVINRLGHDWRIKSVGEEKSKDS